MNRPYITVALATIAVVLIIFRAAHHRPRPSPRGLPTVLVHDCSNEEAWRTLGDDRQIIVTSHADGSLSINELPFTATTIGPELAKVYQHRTLKLAWYIADPRLTYGQAITNLSDLHQDRTKFIVAMPTRDQVEKMSLPVWPTSQSQCPYGF